MSTHKMTKPQPVSKQRIVNFIDSFFKENHHNFYILKPEVDINELIKKLKTLIKSFGESLKIPLRIDPRILKLCKSGKDSEERSSGKYLKTYFTNEKQQFKELYNRTNSLLTSKNGINMRKLLRISNENNNKISKYLETTNSKLKRKLISEIRLRIFAIECGFETWEQLKNMFRLFKFIYNKKMEKYFDFNSDINNNESNGNSSNLNFLNTSNNDKFTSKILSGLNLRKNANDKNENANDNNENEWWTYNNPRSRELFNNRSKGMIRANRRY